jgi:branched-subunit amino acid ABC-type transport system permease component
VVASIILAMAESLVGVFFAQGSSWAEALSFVVLIAVLLLRPRGLFGLE